MTKLVQEIGEALQRRGELLACAESCTGGLVAKTLTDVAGSSAWFERGLVTYSNLAKVQLLGVPQTTVALHGAVSEKTVRAMAEGLIRHTPVDWGLAVTGIAGPGGGTADKPVGTVWIGWSRRAWPISAPRDGGGMRDIHAEVQQFLFEGDREQIRRQSLRAALSGLLLRLRNA